MERVPFITYREKDSKGVLRYYVLQKDHPHNVGVIISQPDHEAIVQSVIPGYNLWIVWDGVLMGRYIHASVDYAKELQVVFDNMSAWFWAERIALDKKRFEKFKAKSNVTAD